MAFGVALGDLVAMTLSMLGIGALLLDHSADFVLRILVLESTFLVLASPSGFAASRACSAVANPRATRAFNRTGGTLLVGAGIATAAIRSGH